MTPKPNDANINSLIVSDNVMYMQLSRIELRIPNTHDLIKLYPLKRVSICLISHATCGLSRKK